MPFPPDSIDWSRLRRLRAEFLDFRSGARAEDYWSDPRDLELYAQFFAERIGWKWDAVLEALPDSFLPAAGWRLIDWGCGTGIATERFLERFGPEGCKSLVLWDRSARARAFAARAIGEKTSAAIQTELVTPGAGDIVVLSHVINELSHTDRSALVKTVANADLVLWVEPGTPDASRHLIEVRETLRDRFELCAPCTTQSACGMLTPENQSHWCHFFAPVPSVAFQDATWARFSKEMEIDLRALPVSYLVLKKKTGTVGESGKSRVIGRARTYKGLAKALLCGREGVREQTFLKRFHKDRIKILEKIPFRYLIEDSETEKSS